MVQWLGLNTFTAVSLGFILVGELICHKLCDMAKKNEIKKNRGKKISTTKVVSIAYSRL